MCPMLHLGVDVGFLGFVDCAGVCCSPSMGLTLFKLYPISVMWSMFQILEKEVLFMWGLFQHELTVDYCGLLQGMIRFPPRMRHDMDSVNCL